METEKVHLRPLSDAPRNGTDILLYVSGRPPIVAGWFEYDFHAGGWYSFDRPHDEVGGDLQGWLPIGEPHTLEPRPC